MPTFIKTGFWEKTLKGKAGWLNLDHLIQTVFIPNLNYKVYTARITQVFNNTPEVTILNNTTGDEIVWTRHSTGIYHGSFQNIVPDGRKTIIFLNQNRITGDRPVTSLYEGDGVIKLFSTQFFIDFNQESTDYQYVDINSTAGVNIEIRIYN